MFAGTLTKHPETAATAYSGMIHSTRFDISIQHETRTKMSERSPDYDITAVNKSGRKVRIGTAWNETGNTTGNDYVALLINTPDGDLRANAVQNEEQRGGKTFSIIPFVESAEQERETKAGLALVA